MRALHTNMKQKRNSSSKNMRDVRCLELTTCLSLNACCETIWLAFRHIKREWKAYKWKFTIVLLFLIFCPNEKRNFLFGRVCDGHYMRRMTRKEFTDFSTTSYMSCCHSSFWRKGTSKRSFKWTLKPLFVYKLKNSAMNISGHKFWLSFFGGETWVLVVIENLCILSIEKVAKF